MSFKKFYNVVYDDKGRRHWKSNEEETSVKNIPEVKKKIVNIDFSKPLETRTEDIKYSKSIGTIKISTDIKEAEKYLGLYCKLCDFSASDNHTWLDHLNSFDHNRHLGNHMKVEKVTVDTVSEHLNKLKRKNTKKAAPKLEDILARLEEGQPIKKQKLLE